MYHTTCDDAQTDQSLVLSIFPQINVSGKQNHSQKCCEARNVSNAQTELSLRHLHVLHIHVQPNSIQAIRPMWPNSLCRFLMIQKLSVWTRGNCPQIHTFSMWTVNDQFVSVVALSESFNRQSLMVRYVYIRPVHNIGKKLVILLRGAQAELNLRCYNEYLRIVCIALFWRVS